MKNNSRMFREKEAQKRVKKSRLLDKLANLFIGGCDEGEQYEIERHGERIVCDINVDGDSVSFIRFDLHETISALTSIESREEKEKFEQNYKETIGVIPGVKEYLDFIEEDLFPY